MLAQAVRTVSRLPGIRNAQVLARRGLGPGGRQAVAGGAQKIAGAANNPFVQAGVGLATGGIPGLIAAPIAGKFMGPAGAVVAGAAARPAAAAVNQGVVQPITGMVTDARREGGGTAATGDRPEDSDKILSDQARANELVNEATLNAMVDPRFVAAERRRIQDMMQVNNQSAQLRASINRDQYLANNIQQGMVNSANLASNMLNSVNAYARSF